MRVAKRVVGGSEWCGGEAAAGNFAGSATGAKMRSAIARRSIGFAGVRTSADACRAVAEEAGAVVVVAARDWGRQGAGKDCRATSETQSGGGVRRGHCGGGSAFHASHISEAKPKGAGAAAMEARGCCCRGIRERPNEAFEGMNRCRWRWGRRGKCFGRCGRRAAERSRGLGAERGAGPTRCAATIQ